MQIFTWLYSAVLSVYVSIKVEQCLALKINHIENLYSIFLNKKPTPPAVLQLLCCTWTFQILDSYTAVRMQMKLSVRLLGAGVGCMYWWSKFSEIVPSRLLQLHTQILKFFCSPSSIPQIMMSDLLLDILQYWLSLLCMSLQFVNKALPPPFLFTYSLPISAFGWCILSTVSILLVFLSVFLKFLPPSNCILILGS